MASPRWLHADQQGSIVAVSDASGASIATNRYDEYGIPQASNLGRFQYTGQASIPELGMYHYKARIYSPTLGRFLQTDPVGYEDQINLYAYVGNDPVNGVDPTGNATVYVDATGKQVLIIQKFDNKTQFSDAEISAMGAGMSGTASDGTNVTTQLVPGTGTDTISLSTNAKLDDTSANGADRSHINSIGGREVQIAPNAAGPATAGHEIGHGIGAGDQYKGGVGVDGKTLTQDVPGAANMMKTSGETQMNAQSLIEMKNAPTNTVVKCSGELSGSGCK